MLEAHERDAASVDHELAGVRRADADHEHDVDVAIHGEQLAALLLGVLRQRDDIRSLEHREQIGTSMRDGRPRDVREVRTIGVDHVIVPVRLEDVAVGGEVTLISGEAVGAIQNGEKIGQQIDQHSTGARGSGACRGRWTRNDKCVWKCEQEPARREWHIFSLSTVSEDENEDGEAPMTTLQQVELQCPICDTRFRSQTVVSTNSFGGKRTDFHERAAGTQPLPYLIHMCNRCGFSGSERDFTEESDVSPVLREHVWNELAPAIATGSIVGSEKYEAAAKVADWQGMEPRHVADLLLRAAWCCVDEGDIEAERFFRRKASWKFEEALSSFDGVPRDERAVLTYLVGELWRRVGDARVANAWFNRVQTEVVDPASQQWVVDAARQQRDCPREWFG